MGDKNSQAIKSNPKKPLIRMGSPSDVLQATFYRFGRLLLLSFFDQLFPKERQQLIYRAEIPAPAALDMLDLGLPIHTFGGIVLFAPQAHQK